MYQEFETQVLDINKEAIIAKLRQLGAKEEPEVLQKRWIFDIEPCTKESTGRWVRLRQVGKKKPTITYKNRGGKNTGDTTEIEVVVDDFGKTYDLLSAINFDKGRYYQENKRHKFVIKDIEFTIDTWPMIPPLLEVEARSKEAVAEGLKMLGLTGKEAGDIGMVATYHRYNIEIHSYKELKF
ncbi:MAG: CYTH domain-containing protein [Candidatus Berkelbacteria bacterium]